MKIWNVNMEKLNEDDLNDCETFMLIDYILAMRKKIKELQIEVKQIGHSFIQKCELLNKALDTIKAKEEKCERLEDKLKKIAEFRHSYCMDCEDLLKPSHSCKGCNMVALKRIFEGKENE